MAIYHLEGKIISRSQGRSAVAAAAYRSASCLLDKRTGLTHDFLNKQSDCVYAEILLPDSAPAWMSDREKLWNTVEEVEKRKDAQLAREFNIALPKELTVEQNIALAKEFISHEFIQLGMVADVCFHRGHGDEQPHLHVMLTLREVSDDGFGKKVREWNDKALILHWREAWSNTCNHHLALHGHDIRIDHRSLEAQGIHLEPQNKIGAKAAREKKAKFEEHQRIAYDNGQRIFKDPSIALNALTHYQSTFTHHDIAKFVSRHTATQEQFREVYEKVKSSPELVHLGQDKVGKERYTTQAMSDIETQMVQQAETKRNQLNHHVSKGIQKNALASKSLNDEQKAAFSHLMNSGDIAAVIGFAGTGKSHMLGAAKDAWEQAGFSVKGMTLSGIAAENLEAASGIQSYTIANRFINWDNDREKLTNKDIIVIDEAGMVGSKQMARILDEATKANAKVVLIGDIEQLQAIEAGAAFRAIIERTGFAELSTIRRQKEAWQQEATKLLATQQTEAALTEYQTKNHVHAHPTKETAMQQLIEQWQETHTNEPNKTLLILAYTRNDVKSLNEQARQVRKNNQELGKDIKLETSRGERNFAKGDRIYFLRNEKSLAVKNGSLGTLIDISHNKLTVELDKPNTPGAQNSKENRQVQFHLSDYNDIDHGYAATIHKSQGSTVDRSFVLASTHFDRHTTYVALSRHRDSAELFYANDEFRDFSGLTRTLSRERAKDVTLDYAFTRAFRTNQTNINVQRTKLNLEKDNSLDNELNKLVHQYKAMLMHRYQIQESQRIEIIESILDKMANFIYQNSLKFAKIKSAEPKLSQIIQARAARTKSRSHAGELEL